MKIDIFDLPDLYARRGAQMGAIMKIGYAMYSARDLTTDPASMRKVLKALSEMGYEGVEFFLYNGTDASELRAMLEEYSLTAIGTHVHKPRWDADTQGEIAYAQQAGIPYLVYPWIEPALRNETFYQSLPKILKDLSALCEEKGIHLQYHNHDFEFEKLAGEPVLDYLMGREDSFTLELDTFWARYAGADAVAYMKKYGSRIPMIHIKDYLGEKDGEMAFTAIGTGKMDNAEVIRAAREQGKEWLIVELDNSPLDPLESARISIEAIRRILSQ